jgi:hypothetical protein
MFDQIPSDKRDLARHALARMGVQVQALEPLSGGLSGSGVWRVWTGGQPLVLKIERPPDGLNDYGRQYACMAAAAGAGVCPRLLFADAETGVAVIEHIAAWPLPDRAVVLREAADLLRRLHAAPLFPPLIDFPDGVERLIERLRGLDLVDAGALAPVLALWAELRAACRWGEDGLVSSHNDPNPRNLIWDGGRLWLIDWEAAFRNDPFVDLAIVANYFGGAPGEDEALLQRYLGAPPGERQRAKLLLMRQVCRIYYGVILINSAAGWTPTPQMRRLQGQGQPEIGAAIAAGRVNLGDPAGRFAYGAATLRQALAEASSRVFQEAVSALA